MRTTITREITESKINGFMIEIQEGKPTVKEVESVTVYGKISKEKALKELKKVYGKDAPVSVSTIDETTNAYEISVADFVKNAKKVEKKTDSTPENKNEMKAEVN